MKHLTTEQDPDSAVEKPEEPEEESGKMSFLEHLDELRRRIIRILLYVVIGFCACFYFADPIYRFLAVPLVVVLPPGDNKLVVTTVTGAFAIYVKVAVLAGIFLTIPLTLYEVWKFISPGLYRKEKRYVIPFLVSSVFLFLAGGGFAYYIVLPRAYAFLIGIGSERFKAMITADQYMDTTIMIILGFGLIFEFPVIVAFLSIFGLVTAGFLWRQFKYAILVIFILAAVISPTPDAVTQVLYAAPMVVLYVISIGVAALFGWRRKRQGLV
jgi:sec-independent protein translocase protein TatC